MTLAQVAADHVRAMAAVWVLAALAALAYRGWREPRGLRASLLLLLGALGAAAVAASANDPALVQLAGAASLVVGGFGAIQVATAVFFRVLLPRVAGDVPRIANDLTAAGLATAWAFACLRLSGLDPSQLFTTSALLTAVIAVSMQDTLGNVLGGVVVQLDHSLRVGDWVRGDDINGRVTDVRWRYTKVETRGGELVVVPNTLLMKTRFFVIRSRPDGTTQPWRRAVMLQVDAQAEPSMVIAALEQGVRDAVIAHVLAEPPPSAVLVDIGPGYCRYALRYWLADPRFDDPCDSAVRVHALAALERAGTRIGVPQEERLTVKENDGWHAARREREAARRLDAIRATDLFARLPLPEQQALAQHLVHAPFAAGDTMTREGAVAHWLYLIVRGEARVMVAGPGGPVEVGRLNDGSIFGEMGMLTGQPRSATVVADTAVDCYRLDKVGFSRVLHGRPELAREISQVVEARTAQSSAAVGAAGAPTEPPADLLERILGFFSMRADPGAPPAKAG